MDTTRKAATASELIGVIAAVATAVTGFVLADIYRPHSPGAVVAELSVQVRQSHRWSDWHRIATVLLVLAAMANLGLTAALIVRARAGLTRRRLLISAAVVPALMSVATVATRPLVAWDQLALWAVTVGSEFDGYWTAAFGDEVRFVTMGNAEVTQGEYAVALVIHLAAPVVAAVAFCMAVVIARGRNDPASDSGIPTT